MAEDIDFKSAIAAVKSAYDIVDYMRGAGIDLKPGGIGKWKANCPFHKEKTPSFTVNESFQNYRCFGCGAKGDLISFVTDYENFSFIDAVKKLAEDKSIVLTLGENESGVDYKSLQKILKISANFYCQSFNRLPEEHAAKQEITNRGLVYNNSNREGMLYGYSPMGNALYKKLHAEGFSDDLIVESGVCRKNEKNGEVFDFFRSRLMFILTDRYNKPLGFSSRKLFEDDNRGKYVNSSENAIFNKSSILYNHALARKNAGAEKELFIVEGQFDVAAFIEAGMGNVVAGSGTAFTRDHINECKKMVGKDGKLVFCFDGDAAGVKAASKIFIEYPDIHEDAYVVVFPDKLDPCDYRQQNGNEEFREYVSKPITMVEFMIRNVKNEFDMDSVVGKAKYVDEASRYVKTVSNMTLRDNCVRMLSLESFTPIDVVKEAVKNAEPLTFASIDSKISRVQGEHVFNENEEHSSNEPDEEEEINPEVALTNAQKFQILVQENMRYALSARFVELGLHRKAWRGAVIRTAELLPKEIHPFLVELEGISDAETLFPEMFEDSEMAALLMGDSFSTFYKFMDVHELKEQFVYLRGRLETLHFDSRKARIQSRVQELLASEPNADLAYFKELLEKEESAIQALSPSVAS